MPSSSTSESRFLSRYIKDVIYGANDGVITTFVIIAGTTGAALSPTITIVMGFANLLADGLSMGFSDFLGIKSERYFAKLQRKKELYEIDHDKDEGKKEVREVFEKRGFKGENLEHAIHIVTSNKKVWLDTMMRDELGIIEDPKDDPKKHAAITFTAFVFAGFFPLIPYLIPGLTNRFILSALTGAAFLFIVGALRTIVSSVHWLRGGLEMLLVGTSAAILAFGIGFVVERAINTLS